MATKVKRGWRQFKFQHPPLRLKAANSTENWPDCLASPNSNSSNGFFSEPCLNRANQGPTKILPFLYLGSQQDALSKETIKDHNIMFELNVSTSCPKPDFISDANFMRIPVNDNYNDKLLPFFPQAYEFLDCIRQSGGCVLVHCLAGISRSATVAISYVMKHLKMTSDEAYRYVKSKRTTISPNFNFLGQLLEYEKQLFNERILSVPQGPSIISIPSPASEQKRICPFSSQLKTLSTAKEMNQPDDEETSQNKRKLAKWRVDSFEEDKKLVDASDPISSIASQEPSCFFLLVN